MAGATRLIKILVSEAAYLIWITRCGRAIRGDELTENETKAAWRRTLNRRISEDTTTASRVLRKPEYIKLIKNTWEKALQNITAVFQTTGYGEERVFSGYALQGNPVEV